MKKQFALVMSVIFVLCSVTLFGCGNKITAEDIVGIYQVTVENQDKLVNDSGIYTFYIFGQDNSFVMQTVVGGESFDGRVGTWEIVDGQVTVDVPKGEDIEVAGVKYESNPIHQTCVINEGVITFESDGDEGLNATANKVDEDAYKEAQKRSEELGPKKVNKGDTIKTDAYSFTLKSFSWADEIYPSDTSGYYRYYTDQSGESYLVAKVDFKNEGTEFVNPCYATSASITIDGNTYSATVEMDNGDNFLSMYGLDPKNSGSLILFATIPDEVKESGEATLSWVVPDSTSDLGCYYTSGMKSTTYKFTK